MSLSTVLAKALFDNAAESPEELAFRKGDILMVLEQEQEGGPGWWLCSLHGRQGIAPANRLRLLQTAAPINTGMDTCRAPSMDSVNITPRQQAARGNTLGSDDGVYLSPHSMAEGLYQSPGASSAPRAGEMWHMDGGRPRSHSSSGAHSRPERDIAMVSRPRSPSVRGRGVETDSLYQTPTGLSPLTVQYHRSQEVLSSESVYLTPSAVPRAGVAPDAQGETTFLMQRESGGQGNSEGCYLVPRVATTAMSNEDLYQTPTNGVAVAVPTPGASGLSVSPLTKVSQETPSMYQTPTPPGGPRTSPKEPNLPNSSSASASGPNHKLSPATANSSPRPQTKGVSKDPDNLGVPSTPPGARGKLAAGGRGSPLLVRIGKGGIPGSPNFGRKPPPPAPPVRGVTKKNTTPPTPAPKPALPAGLAFSKQPREVDEGHKMVPVTRDENIKEGNMQDKSRMKDPEVQMVTTKVDNKAQQDSESDKLEDQVYDTPPTNRWQQAPLATCDDEDDNIYNTPRAVPLNIGFDQESEIYDVPTHTLNPAVEPQHETYNVPASLPIASEVEEDEEDVYSVPSLPGQPVVPAEPEEGAGHSQVYSIPSPGKSDADRVQHSNCSLEESEPDGGIYDMPSMTLDIPATSSVRRLSVSSTGSGDVQWRTSISTLIQSAWSVTSSAPARELAASLAEILSVWKTSHAGDAPPPLQQAWSRLSEAMPALAMCGNGPPSEALRGLVRCALEDATLLLQSQVRPRLPSQESLSRRPLPALPVSDTQHIGSGMGSRKGSWIQERPLPPPPPPAFPLPPPPASLPPSIGRSEEDDELGNEYAGIGLTPAPPTLPVGDSVGYVKLQGMPEPPADAQFQTENNSSQVIPTAETRVKAHCQLSPSPPLPGTLSLEDSELLSFYSSQSLSHLSCLADSIEALFTSVQGNQPPRVFVSRGKSLIVTAHKLVFIGDTLSRLLSSSDLKAKVTTSGARLCQALKTVVVATKGAAQNYPSVPATQEMVDRVAELSQHAAGFAGLLQRLAEIS
ncbi:embryonal Fyn-associated substrate isoform X1 [Alosa sapidissima]|uniref:embryonal Fyn-associated substrate isoform X1 n=1 Tax=Alosa sapidissima TaxID=34773 RepID=UPI001C0A0485|nr:embryonal Fyn-associated substrate isoform X1 [Alosa sapidissima]XP_041925756.1 embryonal Fyn-associated substrate isoform X1 [Alosa sapidissima]